MMSIASSYGLALACEAEGASYTFKIFNKQAVLTSLHFSYHVPDYRISLTLAERHNILRSGRRSEGRKVGSRALQTTTSSTPCVLQFFLIEFLIDSLLCDETSSRCQIYASPHGWPEKHC
jgi:hypothetical protein